MSDRHGSSDAVLGDSALVLPDRTAVDTFRAALGRDRELFEVGAADGEADWRRVSGEDPFQWDAPRALSGAKRFFFPARETLLRWRGATVEEAGQEVAPFVLFGVRACDLTAIAYQDRFFASDFPYQRRRAQAFLVGVNCLAACPGGFCRDVDAGPFAAGGFDLDLTPLPDGRVVIEIGSVAGRAAVAAAALRAVRADTATRAAFAAAARRADATFPARPAIARAITRLNSPYAADAITDREWQALGPACLACTGCTSLCPTCSCFTIVDHGGEGNGERVRYWDSCLLEGFQREASGHHPAPHPGDRVRRFWYHKFSNDFLGDFGRAGCVGCGRCDVTCPGSIGALHVLGALGSR
jgi:formate hydrogenlyase subunit 6/NADH:ubiquinone oxidoreductase subunit I